MGEQWQQTASILQAVNLPLFARSGQTLPEVDDFMPSRYKRPKKRLASQLFQSADAVKHQAERAKSMFWKGSK